MPSKTLPQYEGLPPHTNRAGYTVPDHTYASPSNRRMRVITIGAGFSGILLAYKFQKSLEDVEHVIYEKNGEIGGAWLENRYLNCACDVPAHSYVYNFALNPHWPELYSKADHIWKYLDRVCRVFGLRKYMNFNHKVIKSVWNEEKGKWEVDVEKTYADNSTEVSSTMNATFFSKLQDLPGLVNKARENEYFVNSRWASMFKDREEGKYMYEKSAEAMAQILGEPRLIDNLVPEFGVGCRRTSPGIAFMEALKKPNVGVHFTPVVKVTPDGPVGADGTTTKVDALICATGFDTTFRPHFPIIGQEGVSLADKFTPHPYGYLGVSVPGFPNYLMFFGPSWPIFDGSVTESLSAVGDLAIKMIQKIHRENIRSMAPRQDVTDAFNEHTQTMLGGTVWADTCSGWYHDKNGRVTAIWPGSALHFQSVIREPRWEDFNIKYMSKHNMWEYFGLGFTERERNPNADKAPYMKTDFLDERFYDYEKFPDYDGPAPTKESSKKIHRETRQSGASNGVTNGGLNNQADQAGFADAEIGHVEVNGKVGLQEGLAN